MPTVLSLLKRVEQLAEARQPTRRPMNRYAMDPTGYARNVLRVTWWHKQQEAAESLLTPPYRTLVKASHNVGKTYLAGSLVNWWYDSFDPGLVLTTAPTDLQVRDLLWKEVRAQRKARGGFRGPKMPRLESSPNHWAHGFTARDGDAFQGRHDARILMVFDEAVGVDRVFWETAKTMFGGEGHAWLCIFNPTDTASQAYMEEMTGNWHVITMSALDHPNIAAELAGKPAPYPSAMRLGRLDELLREWCTPITPGERKATDVEWPPASGEWFRPGPIAESRLLGRWPSQGTYGVWSDGDWQAAVATVLDLPPRMLPEIGCDVARFGDDWTAIHVRRGPVSLHHESHNGWSTVQTAGRLKQLCRQWAADVSRERPQAAAIKPEDLKVKIDDDGVGGGVVDQAEGFSFIPVSAARSSTQPADYPNVRSELWFAVAERARAGLLSLARLPKDAREKLRQQAMAPIWKLDSAGRRVVEKKDETKEKIGRSPDDMDAMNLAYFETDFQVVTFDTPRRGMFERESHAARRGLFGRR